MRPAHAYFFGFAQTDGSLYAGTGQRGRLTIELSQRDEAVLHSFTGLFDVLSRVSYRERTTNFGAHRAALFTVCGLRFRQELVALGLPTGRKATTVAPPRGPFSAPDYLRGVIDGDGGVGFTRTGRPFLGFVTASQPLAEYFCAQALDVAGAYRTVRRKRATACTTRWWRGSLPLSLLPGSTPTGAWRSNGSAHQRRSWPHGQGQRACEHDRWPVP